MKAHEHSDARYGPVRPQGLRCVRKWSTSTARVWTEDLLSRAADDPRVQAIVGVGSAVREVSDVADLDLVVVCNPPQPEFAGVPIDVDLRTYPRQDVERLVSEGHELLGWAVLYGCPILDRDSCWHGICQRWRGRVPLPSAAMARSRAEKTQEHLAYLESIGDADAAQEQHISMLTHLARAALIDENVYPASRPELPAQLDRIGEHELGRQLSEALKKREIARLTG